MTYQLPAKLNKNNVMDCHNRIKLQLEQSRTLEVDASSVAEIDSAGIALLIELISWPGLKLIKPSSAISELAELYQLSFDC